MHSQSLQAPTNINGQKHTVSVDLSTSKKSIQKNTATNQMFMTFKNKSNEKQKSSPHLNKFKQSKSNSMLNTQQKLNFSHSKSKSKLKSYAKQHNKKSKNKSKDKNSQIQNSPKKQQIADYDKKVRKNNKKFISRQGSAQNLQMRVPWGVDEPRLNNYVLQTLAKMSKLRKQKPEKRENTFNTQRSQDLKQSEVKLQLTPKRGQKYQYSKNSNKVKQRIQKSPLYDQKTKEKSRDKKMLSQQHPTQKPIKKSQNSQNSQYEQNLKQKQKQQRTSEQIYKSFNGEFQNLQRNNLYQLNFRIVNKKIIEIEVAILKKAQTLSVTLNKGSLQCQSIHQNYHSIMPKSSIILMTAVSGLNKKQPYIYPQLHLVITQKNGSFAIQKKILIPYSQVYLLDILTANQLKQTKSQPKIKNKSVIQQIPFRKQILQRLQKIFENNYLKYKNKEHITYIYGFWNAGAKNLLKLSIYGYYCTLQCETTSKGNTVQILQNFQSILGI